jgi:hypothetical protein
MANSAQIIETARDGFATQESQLATAQVRQVLTVITRTAMGTGDIADVLSLDTTFRLVFVRCHFSGSSTAAAFTISLDSVIGSTYDVRLFSISKAGLNRDVNFRVTAQESIEPSPWSFQAGDGVRIQWLNPDSPNITWGLEVGFAIAS